MLIEGIGLSCYRSFGQDLQFIGPLNKINLFAGQNNSGKSNILSFLKNHYEYVVSSTTGRARGNGFKPIDRHLGSDFGKIKMALGMQLNGPLHLELLKAHEGKLSSQEFSLIDRILNSNSLSRGTQVAWFQYEANWNGGKNEGIGRFNLSEDLINSLANEQVIGNGEWHGLWGRIFSKRQGDLIQNWIPEIINGLNLIKDRIPPVTLISAIRRVGDPGTSISDDYSGPGTIERLARLQNPAHDQQALKVQFDQINYFLQEVTENRSARLEIPFERDTILVHMDNKVLPLSSLGTGIHEVVILATAATSLTNQIICLEEPELHLHPLLQKKLLYYLENYTDNQYFIATHSAHILDSSTASVFHVRYQDNQTVVDRVVTSPSKSIVISDLGYRASDLLQTNCVIWVEGPSDRILLKHWVSEMDDKLLEGVHYTIMFYGGKLRSHLSAFDPEMLDSEINDFISLRRINRFMVILMDSDISSTRKGLDHTKERLAKEFEDEGPGFSWITYGREVENYIRPDILLDAIKEIHPNAVKLNRIGQLDNIYHYRTEDGTLIKQIDKVKVALQVAKRPANFDVYDLKERVEKLVMFIKEANNIRFA
ncbi:MAG: AAA family ATPase [Anaerolineae bacterium]|nr:AAA family ATPase [Anaerolineae bacterium]